MRRSWTPSIVPNGTDQTVYLVLNDFGQHLGRAYCEAIEDRSDLETTISDLISGQYDNPVRVVAFNTAEHCAQQPSKKLPLGHDRGRGLTNWIFANWRFANRIFADRGLANRRARDDWLPLRKVRGSGNTY
jgi:hypothetical protein